MATGNWQQGGEEEKPKEKTKDAQKPKAKTKDAPKKSSKKAEKECHIGSLELEDKDADKDANDAEDAKDAEDDEDELDEKDAGAKQEPPAEEEKPNKKKPNKKKPNRKRCPHPLLEYGLVADLAACDSCKCSNLEILHYYCGHCFFALCEECWKQLLAEDETLLGLPEMFMEVKDMAEKAVAAPRKIGRNVNDAQQEFDRYFGGHPGGFNYQGHDINDHLNDIHEIGVNVGEIGGNVKDAEQEFDWPPSGLDHYINDHANDMHEIGGNVGEAVVNHFLWGE